MPHYENLPIYLRLELKVRKRHYVLEFNQPQWLKPYEENDDKDGKVLYKLMNNTVYGKTCKQRKII